MSKPFDATIKDLAALGPSDFLSLLNFATTQPVRILNADLSTVTTLADVVFGLGDPLEEIVHLDAQSSAAADLHRNVLGYNSLLYRAFAVPVHSIVLLLRPQAEHANLTGSVKYAARPGRGKMDFEFEVISLWEIPVDRLLDVASWDELLREPNRS